MVKAAKQYMYWLKENPHPQIAPVVMADNTRTLTIRTPDGIINEMKARPRDANGCRGDAPHVAMLDEFVRAPPTCACLWLSADMTPRGSGIHGDWILVQVCPAAAWEDGPGLHADDDTAPARALRCVYSRRYG